MLDALQPGYSNNSTSDFPIKQPGPVAGTLWNLFYG
jgi:hypothetical protein